MRLFKQINIRGFSLIELLVALAIVGIVIVSVDGVITRLLLNGNLIKANLTEVDLKTDICRSLNNFDTCKDHFQTATITQLRLRSGETLEADYVYDKFLKIVKLEVTNSSDPDVIKTLKVYYKKIKVSFETANSSCNSTDISGCDRQSYDIIYNFDPHIDVTDHVCFPVYCGNNANSNPHSITIESRHRCQPEQDRDCILESAFSGTIRIGQCTDTKNKGSCEYECRDDGWHAVSYNCRKPYNCIANNNKKNCSLPDTEHEDLYYGNCKAGYTGICHYLCEDGEWIEKSNNCAR